MILQFKKRFVEKVLNGSKLNTIRANKGSRWKVGSIIHFWQGSPRNPSAEPYQFGLGKVTKILPIKINPKANIVLLDGKQVKDLESFARADGFESWAEMFKFFPVNFSGSIIYWDGIQAI